MTDRLPLPPIWNVPYRRNEYFTGREDALVRLHAALEMDKTAALTQPQGISGLDGIGKTQTALEFAYRYADEYQAVLWLRSDSTISLTLGFVNIAHLLSLPEKDEPDQRRIVEAVMRWLRIHTHWLLIFDNVDDLTVVEPFIPKASRGHILLTTRTQALGGIAQRVQMDKMQPEVGAWFLLRRANILALEAPLGDANADECALSMTISQLVDGLPLALDQAGAYIKETQRKYAQGERFYKQALAIWEKVLGPEHPHMANTLHNLALLYVDQGWYEEAETLYTRALAIWEKAVGPEHPNTATILENHAALLEKMQREDEARKLRVRALAIRVKHIQENP